MQTETSYLGMRLAHPFIAGASPLGYRVDTVKRLEDAGCAAVVLHSLFEGQITFEQEPRFSTAGSGLPWQSPGVRRPMRQFIAVAIQQPVEAARQAQVQWCRV